MINRSFVFSLLFLAITTVDAAGLRKKKPCINGQLEADKCFCDDGWTGALCHRVMHCEGYERIENGSCVSCSLGWYGPDCDAIFCHEHGESNYDETSCSCDKPYSGDYCETFRTEDIYSYYNNFASRTGAWGVLTIVPLFIIYMSCEHCARRRQLKRVENHLNGTVISDPDMIVNKMAVAQLLKEKEREEEEEEEE